MPSNYWQIEKIVLALYFGGRQDQFLIGLLDFKTPY